MNKDDKARVKEFCALARHIFCHANPFNDEMIQAIVKDLFVSEHRTNQQCIFKNMIMPVLKSYAERDSFDDRNKATVDFCHKIKDVMDDTYFPYI